MIVEEVHRVGDAGARVEYEGRDRSARCVAAGAQHPRQGRVCPGIEPVAQVVPYTVTRRGEARHHRDVGGQRQRGRGRSVLEEDRIPNQRVEMRCRHRAIAVGRQMVGPQRVDGDEDHGRAFEGPGCRRLTATRSRQACEERDGQDGAYSDHARSRPVTRWRPSCSSRSSDPNRGRGAGLEACTRRARTPRAEGSG